MGKDINLTLPEWAFLDGNSHLADTLEGRNVLQHIQSYTIMEFFLLVENTVEQNLSVKTKEFTYKNIFGETERHLLAVHFTLANDFELDWIMHNAIEFYKDFMDWEDKSLIIEETSKDN